MALPKRTAMNVRPATTHTASARPARSFGRPKPTVITDEERAWFEGTDAHSATERAQAYIQQRFANLLLPDDIEFLAGNAVMVELVGAHYAEFVNARAAAESANTQEIAATSAPVAAPTFEQIFGAIPKASRKSNRQKKAA